MTVYLVWFMKISTLMNIVIMLLKLQLPNSDYWNLSCIESFDSLVTFIYILNVKTFDMRRIPVIRIRSKS